MCFFQVIFSHIYSNYIFKAVKSKHINIPIVDRIICFGVSGHTDGEMCVKLSLILFKWTWGWNNFKILKQKFL